MRRACEFACLALACVLAQALPCAAQRPSLEVQGYAKNLSIRLSSPQSGADYLLNVSRFRARSLLEFAARVHAEVWLDTELLAGSYLRSDDYRQARARAERLEWTLGEGAGYEARQRLFRAFASLRLRRAVVVVGRQRIAWGSGFAWNPTDILNPFNPGAIELGERSGVDAVHVSMPLGPLSRLELVAAYTAAGAPGSYAVRGGTNYRAYDVRALLGRFARDWVVGGDFAGYVRGAGVRGEAAFVRRYAARDYLRAVLNADYTFGDVYGLVEIYYNGRGHAQKAAYDWADLSAGDTYNLAQWYAAVSATVSITPLCGMSLYQLANLTDGSLLVGPAVTYSLTQTVELAAAAYFFTGRSDTEYGRQRHVYFATLQWYF